MSDPTRVVAEDDPEGITLKRRGAPDIHILSAVMCEAVADFVYVQLNEILDKQPDGCALVGSVEVWENGGRSALYALA